MHIRLEVQSPEDETLSVSPEISMEGLNAFIEEELGNLRWYFIGCVGSLNDAEDLTQKTVLKYIEYLRKTGDHYDQHHKRNILRKIARNERANFIRENEKSSKLRRIHERSLLTTRSTRPSRPTEYEILNSERREILTRLTKELSKVDQAIIALYMLGYDDTEISEALENSITPKTVRNRRNDAIKRLELLNQLLPNRDGSRDR